MMLRTWTNRYPGPPWYDEDSARMTPSILTSVTGDEAARLFALAGDIHGPKKVLEVGSARGYSAVVMARAGALVTAVDDHSGGTWLGDTYGAMTANLAAYGVTAEIIRGRSEDVLPRLGGHGRRFGLVFVDAGHDYYSVRTDVTFGISLLEPGGVLACHDYREDNCPGVAQALDELYPEGPDELTGTLWEKVLP